ncbi:permease [Parageobacillus thermoglucosidasius]|uniref:permease n=1 Tax=Parageobacillus thermoglucosidasius TaxID=1426 RepID=UPI002E233E11|nr:permease [Parageobacillus thermoglucosidasius]MED4912776.1 permease [Parageobacillus thermoglucosidasius]MED4945166.1 permease [Parageobacillus thermoglucosidasius]MED4982275.1 permease [Parageobacillus thermoglucosidasius]
MYRRFSSTLIDITGIVVTAIAAYFMLASQFIGAAWSRKLPDSFQQFSTIFLSIIIEAIPFVLIGVIIAGCIQIFVTEGQIRRWIPKNRFLAVIMGCVVGAFFPACECGIVPIVRRLVAKGVPLHAAVGFLLTGPLINPIVILSTYMAFGNDGTIAALRMGIGFIDALIIALAISFLFPSNQLKAAAVSDEWEHVKRASLFQQLEEVFKHSIDEFFDMGKYLIIGACIAALMQTYVHTKSLFLFGDGDFGKTIVMMGLAYFLSLCSEADAFIAASLKGLFPISSIIAFLVYGPMIDLKNTIMLLSGFRAKFVLVLFVFITFVVFVSVHLTKMMQGGGM